MLLTGCGGADEICDAADLAQALGRGEPLIRIGACRIDGDFSVPPGVVLAGAGPASVLAGQDVTLEGTTGAAAIRLEDLTVEAGSRAGVVLRGDGSASVARIAVSAQTGVAFAADGLGTLMMSDVSLTGPVDATNASQVPYPPDRTMVATHGLVLAQVGQITMTDVNATGFAGAGVLLLDSETHWEGGGADGNLGIGAHIQGGQAELVDVSLSGTLRGTWGVPTYGGAFTATAAVDTTNLTADDNWFGLLQHGGSARHAGLSASSNQNAGVWAQYTDSVELEGVLANNQFAGFVAYEANGVHLHDSTISTTEEVLRPRGETGTVMVGDGVQLVGTTAGARLTNLDLVDNERVGLLIELDGTGFAAMELSGVRVTAQNGASGAVCQNGTKPSDWDAGVTRTGVTRAADQTIPSLETVGVVGPCGRPNEIPGLNSLGL